MHSLLLFSMICSVLSLGTYGQMNINNQFFGNQKGNNFTPQCASSFMKSPETTIDEIHFTNETTLPSQGILANQQIFWFIQITDTQTTWYTWDGEPRDENDGRIRNINYFLNTTQNVISPMLIVNTGDLVDSAYQKFITRNEGQRIGEWEMYNSTFTDHNMNASYYFDMMGNHDSYRSYGFEHFLNYSVSGQAFGTDQYMLEYEFEWGTYCFFMPSVLNDYGMEYPFSLGGHMSRSELAWLEDKLTTYSPNTNVSFAFGHQPPFEIFSELSPSGNTFLGLLQENNIDAYFCGHGHTNKYEQIGGLAAIETNKFDDDGGCYRIIAVDQDGISTSYQEGLEWPVGIITNPIDVQHTIGYYDLEKHANPENIHVLAWDPVGIQKVEISTNNQETWMQCIHIEGPLYEEDFDSSLSDGKEHKIYAKITNLDGISKIEEITYKSIPKILWGQSYQLLFGGLSSFVGIVLIGTTTQILRFKKQPEKFQKKANENIDKKQAKILLIKLLILLICPMSFTLLYAEQLSVVFSLFIIGVDGIMYSDIALIFFGIIAGLGVLFPLFCLSPSKKHGLRFFLVLSIIFEEFLLIFYIVHFPTWAWLSPGYYGVLICDILLWKQSRKYPEIM